MGASNILCWHQQQARMIRTVVKNKIINFVIEDGDKNGKSEKQEKMEIT